MWDRLLATTWYSRFIYWMETKIRWWWLINDWLDLFVSQSGWIKVWLSGQTVTFITQSEELQTFTCNIQTTWHSQRWPGRLITIHGCKTETIKTYVQNSFILAIQIWIVSHCFLPWKVFWVASVLSSYHQESIVWLKIWNCSFNSWSYSFFLLSPGSCSSLQLFSAAAVRGVQAGHHG